MLQKAELDRAVGRDVSRETLDRLQTYGEAILKWTPKINLIAKNSYDEIWSRHILDSVQLVSHIADTPQSWCDLGSGGGLPGIVIAILAAEIWPDLPVRLIESDARKAAFLTMVSGSLGLNTQISRKRIEAADPARATHVSARALAPLPDLLGYCHRHMAEGGLAVLPKGRNRDAELDAARRSWHFDVDVRPSCIDGESAILLVRNLRPKDENR